MMAAHAALFALSLVTLSQASLPFNVDSLEDYLALQRLYRMSQLQADPLMPYMPIDNIDSRSGQGLADEGPGAASMWDTADEDMDESIYTPLLRGAQARDQEHLEHSALQGLHQVAGGTAEGEPNQKQVKTDKPLPAYCNPPNPCPVGKTAAEDNCVEGFQNTMENNKQLLEKQDCPCDTEHMWTCPAGQRTVTSKGGSPGPAALTKVMNQLAQMNSPQALADTLEINPYLTSGQKREKLVAKKSPELARVKRTNEMEDWNPYLIGQQFVAAKKTPKADLPIM